MVTMPAGTPRSHPKSKPLAHEAGTGTTPAIVATTPPMITTICQMAHRFSLKLNHQSYSSMSDLQYFKALSASSDLRSLPPALASSSSNCSSYFSRSNFLRRRSLSQRHIGHTPVQRYERLYATIGRHEKSSGSCSPANRSE